MKAHKYDIYHLQWIHAATYSSKGGRQLGPLLRVAMTQTWPSGQTFVDVELQSRLGTAVG